MAGVVERPLLVSELRVERFPSAEEEPEMVVLGFVDGGQRIHVFLLSDPQAYDLMRQMKTALFDVDPPRSGVGSPGALHGP